MMKILVVFGTRPEAIKLAPVIKVLENGSAGIKVKVCVTSQHRQMLDQALDLFQLTPDYDLDIMRENQNLHHLSADILKKLNPVLEEEKPDWIITQGDTTTSVMAALSAFYHKVKIAHVEAGLRSHDKYSPFPEEMNRKLISQMADFHFAPTRSAKEKLLKEGVSQDSIWVTGNTVVDALQAISPRIGGEEKSAFAFLKPGRKLILVTNHRRESFGVKMERIFQALKKIASSYPDVHIVYPVHLNPHVYQKAYRILADIENIHLIEPLDYRAFLFLMQRAALIISDSGGIQEEAPSLGKYVLVTRETTERPEGLEAGVATLVGNNVDRICQETRRVLKGKALSSYEIIKRNPYGDGRSSQRIAEVFLKNCCQEFIPLKGGA